MPLYGGGTFRNVAQNGGRPSLSLAAFPHGFSTNVMYTFIVLYSHCILITSSHKIKLWEGSAPHERFSLGSLDQIKARVVSKQRNILK